MKELVKLLLSRIPVLTPDQKKEKSIRWMALLILIICFAYLFIASFVMPPSTGRDYSTPIVGFITFLVGYYYGSSSGSTAKSETIDKELLGKRLPVPEVKP